MPEFLRTALGPVLALVGTLVAAVLGYRQWRKQQDLARYGGFLSERQAAYKDLWQELEAVHLYVRGQVFNEEKFRKLVRAANTHIIRAGLHLDPGENKRAADYLTALGNLGRLLAQSAETGAKTEAREDLAMTGQLSPRVMAQVKRLDEAYTAVEETRERLQVLGGNLFP